MIEPTNELRHLRQACRQVADQFDEFGTVYSEALDGLNAAITDFWAATEPQSNPEEETTFDRALKDAFEAGRSYEAEHQSERPERALTQPL